MRSDAKFLVDYANLPVIDLEKAKTPEHRRALAEEARNAMTEHGFFYVINHGYSKAQVCHEDRICTIPVSITLVLDRQNI